MSQIYIPLVYPQNKISYEYQYIEFYNNTLALLSGNTQTALVHKRKNTRNFITYPIRNQT